MNICNMLSKKIKTVQLKEIGRFLVGGGSAVVTDYTVYKVLLWMSVQLDQSKAISFVCGSVVGFIINKFWTFEAMIFSKREVLKYVVLYFITATINTLINKGVIHLTRISLFAFLCATGVSTILNFFGQKFFVFRKEE